MGWRHRLAVLAWSTLPLAAACSGPGSGGDSTAPGLSDFQAAILEDDHVSFGELESAVEAYSSCLEEQGLVVEVRYDQAQEVFSYRFTLPGGDVEAALAEPGSVACHERYIDRVELVWADQTGPTAEEDRAFYERIAQCMRDKGFDVRDAEPATLGFWNEQERVEYDACFEEAVTATGG